MPVVINVKSAEMHVKLRSCYTSRRERTLLGQKTCPFLEWELVACGTVDQSKNLQRTIRSVQEPSADLYGAPQLSRQK